MSKYLDYSGLQHLWSLIKEKLLLKQDKLSDEQIANTLINHSQFVTVDAVADKQDKLNQEQLAAINSGVTFDTLSDLYSRIQTTKNDTYQNLVPIGTVIYTASPEPPIGFLVCDGRLVSRAEFLELFDAIGETYGSGDGETTFALPDLMNRVAWGGNTVGSSKEAGLPNVTGTIRCYSDYNLNNSAYWTDGVALAGAFYYNATLEQNSMGTGTNAVNGTKDAIRNVRFDASQSNAIYGKAVTVQPPALTLLPCIKAFGSVINTGNLDAAQLAAQLEDKLSRHGGIITGTIRRFNANNREFHIGHGLTADPETEVTCSSLDIGWNYGTGDGAGLGLRSVDGLDNLGPDSGSSGQFSLFARRKTSTDTIETCALNGYPNEVLKWGNQHVCAGDVVAKSITVVSNLAYSTTAKSYSLSSYLPDDGYVYNVLFLAQHVTGATSGNAGTVRLYTDLIPNGSNVWIGTVTRTSSTHYIRIPLWLPVGPGRTVYVGGADTPTGTTSIYTRAYQRLYKV